MHNKQSMISRLALLVVLAGFPLTASAVYKCQQASGSSSYQDAPCDGGVEMPHARNPVAANPASNPNAMIPAQPTAGTIPSPAPQPLPSGPATASEPGPTDEALGRLTNIFGSIFGALFAHFVIGGIGGTLIALWASQRNRSFWNWFWLCVIFSPTTIFWFFLFRGEDPVRPDYRQVQSRG